MSKRLKIWTLMALTLCLTGTAFGDAVPFTVDSSEDTLLVRTSQYSVVLQKQPFRLQIERAQQPILNTRSRGIWAHTVAGDTLYSRHLQSWQKQGSRVVFQVTTGEGTPPIQGEITPKKHHFDLTWQLPSQSAAIGMQFPLERGGHWYGGNVTSAHHWPLETGEIVKDPFLSTSNQTTPMWLTSSGSAVLAPTYTPIGFSINENDDGLFKLHQKEARTFRLTFAIGAHIAEAHATSMQILGTPNTVPPKDYFRNPIFNTWIELGLDVNQRDLLDYAQKIRASDLPSTILDIDDKWTTHYGNFEFDRQKFPNPKEMMTKLKNMGFKVALWITPFFEKGSDHYEFLNEKRYLVMDSTGQEPYTVEWWNGTSALIDLSNPKAYDWYLQKLKGLQDRYGVSGFKLDAGDAEYMMQGSYTTYGDISPNQYTDLFARLGTQFEINELRVSWLAQSYGLVQRLRDKGNNWSQEDGIKSLVPHGMTEGLIGYPYFCPDMIGGGLNTAFEDEKFEGMDPELFIRWTQASALMPMMQFSFAPWNLGAQHVDIVRKYARLHQQFGDYIYEQAREASETGHPIAQPLFFEYPEDDATYAIDDQFMLGDRLLVAPVLEQGQRTRDVYLPDGTWLDFWNGTVFEGGQYVEDYPAPLDTLPLFVRM
jgi:alpha-glucosidase (family GH31 glycosyl hydrolase)